MKKHSLFLFLNQTGSEALASKGGVVHILFGWYVTNVKNLLIGGLFAIPVLVLLNYISVICDIFMVAL